MPNRSIPRAETHEVFNQPPPLEGYNPYLADTPLREALDREGARWARAEVERFGALTGLAETIALGHLANRWPPELRTHDRFGNRIDEVEYHPAWYELMSIGVAAEVHALPWNRPQPGAHVVRAAKHYLLTQVEAGVCCPLTMTFAAVPALRLEPSVYGVWESRITSIFYDRRLHPPEEKIGCLAGMAMTEKQGGSDVRTNTTRAEKIPGTENEWLLTGHKWFCSAPMCDVFLTLAQAPGGLTCFLVPRFLPDRTRNVFLIQRLKNKLGNRSNASSEIEYRGTWAQRVGEEGRGVPTILEMVNHTRLDCMIGSSALMRQALAQALHHAGHRAAFGKVLREQPLMRNVLADLALESEAALTLTMHLARCYGESENASQRAFRRLATAVGKYWICKRTPAMVAEALECLGGAGYVEESIMPRLYRESPLSSIWEGSGNVMCLDVLRALGREPETLPALRTELEKTRGFDPRYDAHLARLDAELADPDALETRARRVVERLGLALQASLLLQHAPDYVADAFLAARLAGEAGHEYGTLPPGLELEKILERAWPHSAEADVADG